MVYPICNQIIEPVDKCLYGGHEIHGIYDGSSIDIDYNLWRDKSGNNNNGIIFNNTGIGLFNGLNITHELYAGFNKTIVYGNTTTQITFNVKLNPINHTVFHLCKYRDFTGASKQRIIQTNIDNGIFGFYGNKSGVGYENYWITDDTINYFGDSWVFSTQQNDLYRGNFVNLTLDTFINPTTFHDENQLLINKGAFPLETSDFACGEIIVINNKLNLTEIECIENYLNDKYNNTNYATISPTGSPTELPSYPPTINNNTYNMRIKVVIISVLMGIFCLWCLIGMISTIFYRNKTNNDEIRVSLIPDEQLTSPASQISAPVKMEVSVSANDCSNDINNTDYNKHKHKWAYWQYWDKQMNIQQHEGDDIDIFNNDNLIECDGNVEKCKHIQSIIKLIVDDMDENKFIIHDQDTILSAINDFNHCSLSHDTLKQFEWIYYQIISENNNICDIKNCPKIVGTENNVRNILNKIHCHFIHSYDFGQNNNIEIISNLRELRNMKGYDYKSIDESSRFITNLTTKVKHKRRHSVTFTENQYIAANADAEIQIAKPRKSESNTELIIKNFLSTSNYNYNEDYKCTEDHGESTDDDDDDTDLMLPTMKHGEESDIILNKISKDVDNQNDIQIYEYFSDHSSDYTDSDLDEKQLEPNDVINEYHNPQLQLYSFGKRWQYWKNYRFINQLGMAGTMFLMIICTYK